MKTNPLNQIEALGQSIWIDYIKRDLLTTGKLKKLITEDSLRGMTSNPNIFEKAIAESHDYDDAIKKLIKEGKNVKEIYYKLTEQDVREAADQFRPLYDKGQDGYVSIEVNPKLARDTAGTIEEARRLWKEVNRPNIFIKVPATKEGLPAIKQLISEGINVNVTLLFGLPRYREVVEAYIAGIEARLSQGQSVDRVASVGSFFLSRIDTLLDPIFEKKLAAQLQGQLAVASAKMAYQINNELFHSDRFKKLAEKGAKIQRLLWASTSTKNPDYSDIKYIDSIVAPNTVNTMPLETLDAYRDHGDPKIRINENLEQAKDCFQQLENLHMNIDQYTQQLENEGIEKFAKAYDQLIESLKKKCN